MIYAPEINATVKEAKRPQQPYVPDTLNSGPESAALKKSPVSLSFCYIPNICHGKRLVHKCGYSEYVPALILRFLV